MNSEGYLYLFLGILDTFAILVVIFKLFTMPILRYWFQIFSIAFINSFLSYVLRIEWGLVLIDTFVQLLILISFFVLVLRVRVVKSFIITVVGAATFILIQLLAINLLSLDIVNQTGFIQIVTSAICYILAFIIFYFDKGFNFVELPPHSFYDQRSDLRNYKVIFLVSILVMFAISLVVLFLLDKNDPTFVFFPLFISFVIVLVFSKKKDRQIIEDRINQHSNFKGDI
ncbi:hypothetical protein [Chengkuizengella axinellae]|uniref:Uncharacterized protein n=1 Tax=Chengkuizengella axinellae TaxID=3064388 RepID=A0ABT9J0Y2_9BACL|nr:hypothetical protein [Chengkuizengella sp. 2205SS18-9]MDP5275247.1 hypothetical protein [Chengkuizengella sp. 2205SS18-9]